MTRAAGLEASALGACFWGFGDFRGLRFIGFRGLEVFGVSGLWGFKVYRV